MNTPRVFAIVALAAAAVACNRTDANRDAEHAADQVKVAAAQAGDKLADSWLTAKIQAQFFADDDIKSRYINVTSRNGTVTLKGFVASDDVRRQVLEITRNTDGVKQVDDRQLLVGRPATESFDAAAATDSGSAPIATTGVSPATGVTPPDDGTVTSLIQAKFFLDPTIKSRRIDVQSARGVVTLRGEVASDAERGQALALARTTQGVDRVEDNLTVDASLEQGRPETQLQSSPAAVVPAPAAAAATSIEQTLQSRFAADTSVKGSTIHVSASGGVVTLQGTVPTQSAKQRVLTLARETEGVAQVIDRITVARPK